MSGTKNKGGELERMVRAILRDLQSRRLCYLWKLPTDLRLTRNGLMPGDPMPADFMGWRNDGKCILIECKDVDRPWLPLGKSPGLTPFQLQAVAMARMGGVDYYVLWQRSASFMLLRFVGDPFSMAKSLPWSDEWAKPMAALPQAIEGSIMSQYETPLPGIAPRPERLRHCRRERRAGPS